jgi:hypothetical protein
MLNSFASARQTPCDVCGLLVFFPVGVMGAVGMREQRGTDLLR